MIVMRSIRRGIESIVTVILLTVAAIVTATLLYLWVLGMEQSIPKQNTLKPIIVVHAEFGRVRDIEEGGQYIKYYGLKVILKFPLKLKIHYTPVKVGEKFVRELECYYINGTLALRLPYTVSQGSWVKYYFIPYVTYIYPLDKLSDTFEVHIIAVETVATYSYESLNSSYFIRELKIGLRRGYTYYCILYIDGLGTAVTPPFTVR